MASLAFGGRKVVGEGFGTLYTAVYDPVERSVVFYWPQRKPLIQSFEKFVEFRTVVNFGAKIYNAK